MVKIICPECNSDEIIDIDYEDAHEGPFECKNCGNQFDSNGMFWEEVTEVENE